MKRIKAAACLVGLLLAMGAGSCAPVANDIVPEISKTFTCTVEIEREDAFLSGTLTRSEDGDRFVIHYPTPLDAVGFRPVGGEMEISCHDLSFTVPAEMLDETTVVRQMFFMLDKVRTGDPVELIARNGDMATLRREEEGQRFFIKVNEKTGRLQEISDEQFLLKIAFLDYE